MMAPAMGASAADRGGTRLLLGPGAFQKPGYVAPPASPAVHPVYGLGSWVMFRRIRSSAAIGDRPSENDVRATAIHRIAQKRLRFGRFR